MATDWKDDFDLQDGDIWLIDGDDAYALRVEMRVGVSEGEWPYDRTFGLPWLTRLLGATGAAGGFRAMIARAVHEDPETQTVGAVNVSAPDADRRSVLSFSARSIRGAERTVSRDL